ncbi:MAG: AMP-binding protein [Desulfobacterales bacterium]
MILQSFTIYDIYQRNAMLFGNNVALVSGENRTTYRQLFDQINALAAGLAAKGIGRGDRIGILALNHEKFFHVFGAAAALGAIVSPINWRLSNEEIQYILRDSSPSVMVVDQNHESKIQELSQNTVLNIAPDNIYCFDGGTSHIDSLESLMTSSNFQSFDIATDDPFCIIYTAAVDGKPRGAVLSHGNMIAANMQFIAAWHLTHDDAYLNMLPMFHITGLNLCMAAMHAGGKNVVIEKFDQKAAMELVQKEKISMLGSFAPIMSRLFDEFQKGNYDTSSLKNLTGLESPDTIKVFQEKTGSTFWPLYGQSETTGTITLAPFSEKPGSAGKPALLSEIRMVDENDQAVETGQKGEIVVRGPLVFKGYWNQEEMNQKTFRNNWHHTGDLGRFDENGYLWFAGRKPEKELIKPGGENVYPAEVEEIILEHPGLKEVSVIGVPDKDFGEAIKAICVLKEGITMQPKELVDFVAQKIARYKKPKYVEFVDGLPKTSSGSIDREKVKEFYGS